MDKKLESRIERLEKLLLNNKETMLEKRVAQLEKTIAPKKTSCSKFESVNQKDIDYLERMLPKAINLDPDYEDYFTITDEGDYIKIIYDDQECYDEFEVTERESEYIVTAYNDIEVALCVSMREVVDAIAEEIYHAYEDL